MINLNIKPNKQILINSTNEIHLQNGVGTSTHLFQPSPQIPTHLIISAIYKQPSQHYVCF